MAAEKNVTSQNLLTEKDLSERWQISRERLRKWRMDGIGPAYVKLGGSVRYRLAEITDYELKSLRGGDAA